MVKIHLIIVLLLKTIISNSTSEILFEDDFNSWDSTKWEIINRTFMSEPCRKLTATKIRECVKNIQDVYFDNARKLSEEMSLAAENFDMDRVIYLDKEINRQTCCGAWYGMDCIIASIKVILTILIRLNL